MCHCGLRPWLKLHTALNDPNCTLHPQVISPLQSPLPQEGTSFCHFFWKRLVILCSPALSLQVPSVRVDFSRHSHTNVCHRHSCLVPLSQQRSPVGFGDRAMCLMDSCTLHMTFASMTRFLDNWKCLSSPSQPNQPPKGLETELHSPPHHPVLSLSLNCPLSMSRSSRLFGVVKGSFTQCLWKGHVHRSGIMFHSDSHHQCCACTAAVLKCYGLVVQSSHPPPPPRGGTVTS